MSFDSTICALATAGQGAISVIRVSGPDAIGITESIFQPATPGKTNRGAFKRLGRPGYIAYEQLMLAGHL